MTAENQNRLFQHDIYQRYSTLAALLERAFPDGPVRVLDVGCGPARLTEKFLPERFNVRRADIETFGDPSMVRLRPGEPLPFDPQSVDVVIAMDVLEHVPEDARVRVIQDLFRVARVLAVACFPEDSPLSLQSRY
jgi:2-polyprenyl-3-methyl-5-hydroxy-6-metoxy-1,4-benzoquinol methylase